MINARQVSWFLPAFGLVLGVTAARLLLLAFNRTDLFVDETQYWLWGQSFAFGYYSKPPLIAWVIGAVTGLMGDAPFWVRAPGAVFHGAAALVLGALAARLNGQRNAIWVVAAYLTLPFVAVGSLLMSTDTIMAPFFCAALYFHHRLIEDGRSRFAILAGVMAGIACLAKYAAIYCLLGVGLAAMLDPLMRISWRNAGFMLVAFALVILPNIWWNFGHGLATFSHTMDNVGWVRKETPLGSVSLARGIEFLASQFAVMGPVMFAALIWVLPRAKGWAAFVWPALVVVTLQAVLDRAYANWAVSAFFAGTVIAVGSLAARPRMLALAVGINAAISIALPVLTLMPGAEFGRNAPILERYLGRADLSQQIIDAAKARGDIPVVADSRDVLADLFYTGRDAGLRIFAPPLRGRPMNHYEQTYPFPPAEDGLVFFVTRQPYACSIPAQETVALRTEGGAYAGDGLTLYLMEAACLAQF
jgi:Dolichyl-phosphate-mannose-protein mannosyltransferase